MSKAVDVVRFDILTVKPYLKSFLLLIALGLMIGIGNKDSLVIPPMFMVWASFFVAYPFSIAEKNSLDKLWGTFSLKRKDIVAGRYIFSLCSTIFSMLLAVVLVYASSAVIKSVVEIQALVFVMCMGFFLFSFIVSFQIPLYFKLGYTKARVVTYIPLFAIGFLMPAISFLPDDSGVAGFFREIGKTIEEQPYLAYVICLGASFIMLWISYLVSRKFYEDKEL